MDVALIKALVAFVGSLPRAVALRLGCGMAWFARVVVRYRRTELAETLRRCLPEKSEAEVRQLERAIFRHFGLTAVEFLRAIRRPPRNVEAWVRVEGVEHWEAAKARGKGILGLSGHIGNWELMGAVTSQLGYDNYAVVKHLHNPKPDAFLWSARERLGVRQLSVRDSYRDCLRILRKGGRGVMILDQNMRADRGVFVDFFGRPACTTPGLAILAAQTQSPVLPAYMIRNPDGTHTLRFLPPIPPPADRNRETILEATQTYTRVLEDIIRRHPDQWIWFHRRWRTRPPEESEQTGPE